MDFSIHQNVYGARMLTVAFGCSMEPIEQGMFKNCSACHMSAQVCYLLLDIVVGTLSTNGLPIVNSTNIFT